jgi:hypothetical protein
MPKSRLSNALLQTIQGGKSVKTDKNVFDQAKSNDYILDTNDDHEPMIGEAEETDIEVEPVVPEKSDRIVQKREIQPKRKANGAALNVLTILVSISAIGVAGYAIYNQAGIESKITTEANRLNLSVGDLNQRTDNLMVDFAQAEQSINKNRISIASIDGIRSNMTQQQNTLADFRAELASIKSAQDQLTTSMNDNTTGMATISRAVQALKARPVPIARPAAPRPTPRLVVVEMPNQIEGAVIGSIDVWGTEQYIMLREQSGSWYPLAEGDTYKDWRFSGLEVDTAIFTNGSRTKKMTIVE